MLNSFLSISDGFKDSKIKLKNKNLNELIKKYEFLYIQTISDFDHNQKIYQNIKESKFVIINQNKKQNQKSTDKYFIIGFQRTILLINLSSLPILHSFFSNNPDLHFYYLSDTKEFFENFPKETFIDDFFLEEMLSFNNELYLHHNEKELVITWSIIQFCISGYLIKQSYSKTKKDRIRDFTTFSQPTEKVSIDEEKLIGLRLIGATNSFEVNLFYYIEKEELVAIKRSTQNYNEINKLKRREFENYLNIKHPFLPKFYGTTTTTNDIIIEFINGPTLFNIEKLNLTDDEKFTIIFEIMITIQFLHQKNFIVRDLKPNNVIIDEYKNVVLIDFDRMLNMNDDHFEFTNQFSSPFVAPEVNSGEFSYECDIFSIGCMIYYLMLEKDPTIENFDECLEFENYPKLSKMFLKCCIEPEDRTPLSKLIFSFFINYYSKIKIENLFVKFENYFSNIYENYELDILKKITLNNNSEALFSLGLLYLNGKRFSFNIDKAIKYFMLSADQNYSPAQYILGFIYDEDEHLPRNIIKAIEYYEMAANQNNEKAQIRLGQIFESEDDDQKNINKAIKYYSLAANQGNKDAMYKLGCIFENEIGDINKAIEFYTLAANQGNEDAMYKLGCIFENEIGDINKAIEFYTLAANKNHIKALFKLGCIFEEGKKVKYDINKAIHYYSLGSKLNDKEMQYKLGHIYEKIIKPPNINKAIECYISSADQNYCLAQLRLGNIYFTKDIKRSFHYYTLAAKQNNPEAQFFLGMIYEFDIKDIKKAIDLYQCSANQNNKFAMLKLGFLYQMGKYVPKNDYIGNQYIKKSNLLNSFYNNNFERGNMYFNGENCKKDIDKAIYFYKIASDQNFVGARIKLAKIYLDGYDVPRDINKAIYYYKLAVENNNNSLAKYNLGAIYSEGKYVPIDVEKSMNYFNSITEGELYPYAQYNLGCFYFFGKGKIQKNINKAIDYFVNSAKYNYPESQYNLGAIYFHGEFKEKNIDKAIYYFTLAAKQNFPKAQLALGLIYYNYFNENQKFIQKGIYWLDLAAKNNCRGSYFIVGYIYHEGLNVKRDINKAIHLYKEASNFNNSYAKNNLGIIYKNGFKNEIKKNVAISIEYFKEAIKINNNKSGASIFNLASLYFYESPIQNSIDESIKLLIEAVLKDIVEAIMLLCLALVKKFALDFKSMENELMKYTGKSSSLPFYICDKIKKGNYFIKSVYEEKYQTYKTFDLLYDNNNKLIHLFEFNHIKQYKDESKAVNITSDFYEGFGF